MAALSSALPSHTSSSSPTTKYCPSSKISFSLAPDNLNSHVSPSSPALSISLKEPNFAICRTSNGFRSSQPLVIAAAATDHKETLKVMISGAPASGKGTQCERIVKQHGLVHISVGDLLRAEVAAGTPNGKIAKEYMTKGELVPNEIVVNMVRERLSQSDVKARGWLLDGYPRSLSQAQAIEAIGIRPDVFILLDVPDNILIERVVGRRLDPVTGKIYHLKFSPPENEEVARRLTQRFDDTEAQARLRLKTHSQNVDSVLSTYKDVLKKVDGNQPVDVVFKEIDNLLCDLKEERSQSTLLT